MAIPTLMDRLRHEQCFAACKRLKRSPLLLSLIMKINRITFKATLTRGTVDYNGGSGLLVNGKRLAPKDLTEDLPESWHDDFDLSVGDAVVADSDTGATGFSAVVRSINRISDDPSLRKIECTLVGEVWFPAGALIDQSGQIRTGLEEFCLYNSQATWHIQPNPNLVISSSFLAAPTTWTNALKLIGERRVLLQDLQLSPPGYPFVMPAHPLSAVREVFPGLSPTTQFHAGIRIVPDRWKPIEGCTVLTFPQHVRETVFRRTSHRAIGLIWENEELKGFLKESLYASPDPNQSDLSDVTIWAEPSYHRALSEGRLKAAAHHIWNVIKDEIEFRGFSRPYQPLQACAL